MALRSLSEVPNTPFPFPPIVTRATRDALCALEDIAAADATQLQFFVSLETLPLILLQVGVLVAAEHLAVACPSPLSLATVAPFAQAVYAARPSDAPLCVLKLRRVVALLAAQTLVSPAELLRTGTALAAASSPPLFFVLVAVAPLLLPNALSIPVVIVLLRPRTQTS